MQTSNIRSTITPVQSVINGLQLQNKLPFQDVLSSENLQEHLSRVGRRDRIFTLEKEHKWLNDQEANLRSNQ